MHTSSLLFMRCFVDHYSRYAKTVGAKHFHTSAKLNKGIEEMFFELSKRECSLVASFMVIISLDAFMATLRIVLINLYLFVLIYNKYINLVQKETK